MNPTTGRHLSFPFRIGKDGRTVQVGSEEEHVRDELVQLLLTSMGERLFLPQFGGGIRRLVFENINDVTNATTKAMLTRAISRWLGSRLTLDELLVRTAETAIEVEIKYRVAGTQERRVMRFERNAEGGS